MCGTGPAASCSRAARCGWLRSQCQGPAPARADPKGRMLDACSVALRRLQSGGVAATALSGWCPLHAAHAGPLPPPEALLRCAKRSASWPCLRPAAAVRVAQRVPCTHALAHAPMLHAACAAVSESSCHRPRRARAQACADAKGQRRPSAPLRAARRIDLRFRVRRSAAAPPAVRRSSSAQETYALCRGTAARSACGASPSMDARDALLRTRDPIDGASAASAG
jgi:hypothetical protein